MRRRALRRRYGRALFRHGSQTWRPFLVEVWAKGGKKLFEGTRFAPNLDHATRSAHQMAEEEWPGRWFAVAATPE